MTAPFYASDSVTVHHGNCLDVLRALPDASVDAVVTDPPYGIAFMGKAWDQPGKYGSTRKNPHGGTTSPREGIAMEAGRYDLSPHAMGNFQRWCEAWAAECLRILKPGGHLLAFGGSRTWHRLTAGVEDAGFEIRDSIAWLYGSGFPKSMSVGKAIDAAAGAKREVAEVSPVVRTATSLRGASEGGARGMTVRSEGARVTTMPATDEAREWEGWGTSLKPAFEPIVVGRKPLIGTVAANVLEHGTGAINIDANRVHTPGSEARTYSTARTAPGAAQNATGATKVDDGTRFEGHSKDGRWPTNVLLDESQATELDRQAPDTGARRPVRGVEQSSPTKSVYGDRNRVQGPFHGDRGGASRFFPTFRYQAKAPTSERPRTDPQEVRSDTCAICDAMRSDDLDPSELIEDYADHVEQRHQMVTVAGVAHPTVKPLDLMRWLVRLVTPPGGTVLEPFAGSGTTAEACLVEGFQCIAIEREAEYLPLIVQRLSKATQSAAAGGEPA